MKGDDFMVDLETLDTRPTAVIMSIGVCHINWDENRIDNPFYRSVSIESCQEFGLTVSTDTQAWWDRQSPEARTVFDEVKCDMLDALLDLSQYLGIYGIKDVRLWGNGSDFDNTILANAYASANIKPPWKFWNNRCFRTAKDMFEDKMVVPERQGTHHNALDDAQHQARALLSIREHIHGRQ